MIRQRIRQLLGYYKRGFLLNVKAMIAYPASFWFVALTIPLWVLVQILFIETIYGQTEIFLGYTKNENYILFGTFKLVQSMAVFLFYRSLSDLTNKIRGTAESSFDTMLLKPIDTQLISTTGRYSFGSISSFLAGIGMISYGFLHEPHVVRVGEALTYLGALLIGVILLYLVYLFIQTWLFWFEYLQIGESLWFSLQNIGHYPRGLYQGSLGVVFNLVIPMTLMAAIPVDFLFGRIPPIEIMMYVGIVAVLTWLTRKFWQYSIKKYSSFSS